jgi:hypothetical protein
MHNAFVRSALLSCGLSLLVACSGESGSPQGDGGAGTCASGCGPGLSCVTNSDFPSGTCTQGCAPGICPTGTVCSPVLSSGASYCLQSCAGVSCPSGTLCSTTASGQVCLPTQEPVKSPISCAAPTLAVGATPGPATQPACRMPVVPSALPPGDVQLLGSHKPGAQVSFQVPAGATGFSIISQAVAGQNGFIDCGPGIGVLANVPVPTPILTPAGATFYDATANIPADLTTADLLFLSTGGQQPYTASLTFPNTSAGLTLALDGGLPAGTWTFDVNDYANEFQGPGGCDAGAVRNTYDVEVVVAPGPFPTTSTLNVDVYLVSKTLTAATAVSNAGVQFFANRFASVYANAGVCVGTMTFHDVPAWAKDAYASVTVDDEVTQDPCSDFRQMLTLALPGRTMALFFVDDMQSSGEPAGDSIVGKDGAIPGMASYNGTIAGGSAVLDADITVVNGCSTGSINISSCGPDRVALIAAHETGHFLGMFHPTEQTGDEFDPLVDTAACVCQLCETSPSAAAACTTNPDGGMPTVVDNTVCGASSQQCGGANLLMFWLLSTSMTGAVTPEEAAVMRANPLLSAP